MTIKAQDGQPQTAEGTDQSEKVHVNIEPWEIYYNCMPFDIFYHVQLPRLITMYTCKIIVSNYTGNFVTQNSWGKSSESHLKSLKVYYMHALR